MATTPPLRTAEYTPQTPRHGAKYDDSRHFFTRKKSRKSSSRAQRAIETPSANSDDLPHKKPSSLRSAPQTFSPPSSTHTSPRKKGSKGTASKHEKDTGTMNSDISLNAHQYPSKDPLQPPLPNPADMLPTPVKTPRKKPVQQTAVNAAAKILFPARPDTAEDAMPTPRKQRNRRQYKIDIYTDSKDKIPELDPSEDNPFYEQLVQGIPPEPSKSKNSKKRKSHPTAQDNKEIQEAFNHEEGMVYVFRGKKIFRKFPQDDPEPEDDGSESNARPFTRSTIKPRLLFPTQQQRREREFSNIEDEEATTDMEEAHDKDMTELEEHQVTTPLKKANFSSHTPPTTGHATRSSTKKAGLNNSLVDPTEQVEVSRFELKGKKTSPFDGWARTKSGAAGAGKGKKREADPMEHNEGAIGHHKRARGNEVI